MEEQWQQFLALLASYAPDIVKRIQPGVDDAAIAQAEQRLGIAFSGEVKAFFRLQNGSEGPILGSWAFLSLDELCDDWLAMKAKTPMPDAALGRAYDYWERAHDLWCCNGNNPEALVPWKAYFEWCEDWVPLLRASHNIYIYARVDHRREVRDGDFRNFWHEDLMRSFSREEKRFYNKTGVYPRHRWSTVLSPQVRNDRLASSITQFLEKLIAEIRGKTYVYDERIGRFRTLKISTRILRWVDEPLLYYLDYDIPGTDLKYGNQMKYPGLCCISYERASTAQRRVYEERGVVQSWKTIVSVIQEMAPEIVDGLQPGVSKDEIKRVEQDMKVELPNDVKEWYQLANGRVGPDAYHSDLFDTWYWLPITKLVWQEWMFEVAINRDIPSMPIEGQFLKSADPRVQLLKWHPQWIPFMINDQHSILCIDMAPPPQGELGQIILVLLLDEEYRVMGPIDIRRVPPVIRVAPSLRLFLAALSQDFIEGKYRVDEQGRVWSREGYMYPKH